MPEGQPPQSTPPIQTMRDDLAVTKSQPVPTTPKIATPQGSSTSSTPKQTPAPAVPLRAPIPTQKRKGGKLIGFLVLLLLLVGVAGAGTWYYLTQNPTVSTEPTPSPAAQALTDMIPASRLLVAHYSFASDIDRQQMLSVWKAKVIEPVSMRGLLAGNPTLLLEETSIKEFAYVLLPDDPRLYLIVPTSEEINQMVAQRSNVQVKNLGSWTVMHSFSTDLLEQQLAASGKDVAVATTGSFTITVDQLLAAQLSADAAKAASDHDLVLTISLDTTGAFASFSENTFQSPTGLPSQESASDLLAYIPADASKVVVGPDFSVYTSLAATPAGEQFISELVAPFAYFEGVGADGLADYGLVVKIPNALATPVQVGDPTLEQVASVFLSVKGLPVPNTATTFSDGAYLEVPLKYVNIDRLSQVAIDYAVVDDVIAVATSREGMFGILEAARSQIEPFISSEVWATILPSASTAAQVSPVTFGVMGNAAIKSLLPVGSGADDLNFWATIESSTTGPALRGQVTL